MSRSENPILRTRKRAALLLLLIVGLAVGATVLWHKSVSAENTQTFPETGKTVRGKFLDYWRGHGGILRQGFPISGEMQEKSNTDGKTYTVQYFERVVMELHPENAPPFDVLHPLLGLFAYKEKYPSGAPEQHPNTSGGSVRFEETGKRLGGGFLAYWQSNGGLPQFGLPVSDEFTEVSPLNGKPYTVQYFERAVFEWHPENPPPYNVLLSQLGTLRYRAKYLTPPTPTATPTPTGPLFGIDGQGGLGEPIDPGLLKAQYDAGMKGRLLHLGWNVLQPGGPSDWRGEVAAIFQQRIDAFVAQGPDVRLYLDLGIQIPPRWVADIDPLVDQYGNRWDATNGGGANVYWSPTVREHVANYIKRVFTSFDFHGRLWAVRVGPYEGELLYPQQANDGKNLSFWAFDEHAQAHSPVPGWKPGEDSPNGEAGRFYNWYVDNLVDTFNFHLREIRKYFTGYVAPVTPGVGIHEGTAALLIASNLDERRLGFYGTGNYWQRVFANLPKADQGVINWCSSVGDRSGNDANSDWKEWSSAKMQAKLAHDNGREIYGENPGRNAFEPGDGVDERTTAKWIFRAVKDYDYLGLMWVRQADTLGGGFTTLNQLRGLIAESK